MKKKHLNKELMMTKEDNEDFENYIKCWIWDNADNDVNPYFAGVSLN